MECVGNSAGESILNPLLAVLCSDPLANICFVIERHCIFAKKNKALKSRKVVSRTARKMEANVHTDTF